MVGSSEVPRLHAALPVRMVTQRHTQRLIKWLLTEHWATAKSHAVQRRTTLRSLEERLGFARLTLAMP